MNDLRPSHKRRTIFLVILLGLLILAVVFLVPRLAAARQAAQVSPAAVQSPLMGASRFAFDGSGWEVADESELDAAAPRSAGCACDEVSDTPVGSLLLGLLVLGMRFFA